MGGNVKFNQSGENNYVQAQETIPEGYRPMEKTNTPIACLLYTSPSPRDCS